MKYTFTAIICFLVFQVKAQIPEDAIRYSWYHQNGTARTLAIGGAISSLGGDLTAGFVNPAGIGFYKTNDAVFTPGFSLNKNKSTFRDSEIAQDKNAFSFGPSGAVFALQNQYKSKNTTAVSIAITQTANFNNTYRYKGLNNFSSYSEAFAEEFSRLNISIDEALNTQSIAPYTVAPALFTFLIDTVRVNGNLIIKGAPEYVLDAGKALLQEKIKTTSGGLYEFGLSYAGNDGKKFLYGATLGIPIINYNSNTVFFETDTSSNANNQFKSFSYTDNFSTKGAGLNVKLGLIYRPKDYIRLGLAVHTPSYMLLTDRRETTLQTSLENPIFNETVSSKTFTNGQQGLAKYAQSSPFRIIAGGSYVFREIEDVTKQRGFISADIEYVNHRGSRFSSEAEQPTTEDRAYFKSLNNVVKDIYKGNINLKLGGELKFNTIMGRLGFGYYGSPYKDAPAKANRMTASGGLGYRNKGFFVDLTYVHLITKDFDVPYRLQDSQNVFASLNQQQSNIVATFGIKF